MATKLDRILSGATRLDKQKRQAHQLAQMIYGDPSVGKTVLAMKLAQQLRGDGNVLYLDSLEGWVSLEDWDDLRQNVVRIRIDNPQDLVPVAQSLATDPRLKSVTVVVLDEYSAWVKRVAEDYVRSKNGTPEDAMMPVIEGTDWGPIGAIMTSILTKFLGRHVHVIVVAHAREKGGREKGETSKWSPNFTPLLQTEIQGMLHQTTLLTRRLVGRGQYQRQLFTTPSASIMAKSRVGGMPDQPSEAEFIARTVAWTLGDAPTQGTPAAVAAKTKRPAKPAEREDVVDPTEGDADTDMDDLPVIVAE